MRIRGMLKKKHKSSKHRANSNLILDIKISYRFSLSICKLPISALLMYI